MTSYIQDQEALTFSLYSSMPLLKSMSSQCCLIPATKLRHQQKRTSMYTTKFKHFTPNHRIISHLRMHTCTHAHMHTHTPNRRIISHLRTHTRTHTPHTHAYAHTHQLTKWQQLQPLTLVLCLASPPPTPSSNLRVSGEGSLEEMHFEPCTSACKKNGSVTKA